MVEFNEQWCLPIETLIAIKNVSSWLTEISILVWQDHLSEKMHTLLNNTLQFNIIAHPGAKAHQVKSVSSKPK